MKIIILLCILMSVYISCSSDNFKSPPVTYKVIRNYKSGPMEVTLKVSRTQISIAEYVEIHLEAAAPERFKVIMPGKDGNIGKFDLIDFYTPQARLIKNGYMLKQGVYIVEPYLPGEYLIPSMKITCIDNINKPSKLFNVETDEVLINVVSLLPAGEKKPQIRDIAPVSELKSAIWSRNNLILLFVIIFCLSGLYIFYNQYCIYRRKKGNKMALAPKIAMQELNKLLADNLITQGEINQFYTRLSDILRRYIEDRFCLHTSVQTTEEFIEEVYMSEVFDDTQKVMLKKFLSHCDMVKFGGKLVRSGTIQKSIEICRLFINETNEKISSNRIEYR